MNEKNVTKYYTAIAQKVDEIISCEWEKAALYAMYASHIAANKYDNSN